MSKRFDFDVMQFSLDQIGEMSNEELYRQITRVKRTIRESRTLGHQTIPHEVEYCYLDHERQMRHRRTGNNFTGGN